MPATAGIHLKSIKKAPTKKVRGFFIFEFSGQPQRPNHLTQNCDQFTWRQEQRQQRLQQRLQRRQQQPWRRHQH